MSGLRCVRVSPLISLYRVREQKPRLYAETHCDLANRERNGYLYALLVTATRNLLAIDRVQERVPCSFRQILDHSEYLNFFGSNSAFQMYVIYVLYSPSLSLSFSLIPSFSVGGLDSIRLIKLRVPSV